MTRYYLINKFFCITKLFIIYLFFNLSAFSDDKIRSNGYAVLGEDVAPIKIKVFSSFTCPHCANFHVNVVPKIKKKYIQTGKVQLIFIDFPLDQIAFNASKILHCLDQNKQMLFMDLIYEKQNSWIVGSSVDDINKNLKKMAINFGINSNKFDECLVDESVSDKILTGRIEAQTKYSIDSTPTVIINEKKLEGSINFKNIEKNIEKII
jgi:protein-disulfide isomerase